jgi:EAL domain-containing protein (putative c-di-GMP-specific phosphodiesterase class I)
MLGCDTYQGFFYSQAVNAEAATQILSRPQPK